MHSEKLLLSANASLYIYCHSKQSDGCMESQQKQGEFSSLISFYCFEVITNHYTNAI